MNYLAEERSRIRRADPKQILPECKSILVLAIPYNPPSPAEDGRLKIASYALGDDYHDIIPPRLQLIVEFIEEQVGHPIPNRYYTDTGPILERDLAQRAGLGWIGKNTCLSIPKLVPIFCSQKFCLASNSNQINPSPPIIAAHAHAASTACPTECILPNRTLDARRCISYLTIELKDDIPPELRPLMKDWIFGCDICQQVCPWNRFSQPADPAFEPKIPLPVLTSDLLLTSVEFNQRFKKSPIKRAKRRGYLRNMAVAIGNNGNENDIPVLEQAMHDARDEPMVREHAKWARTGTTDYLH